MDINYLYALGLTVITSSDVRNVLDLFGAGYNPKTNSGIGDFLGKGSLQLPSQRQGKSYPNSYTLPEGGITTEMLTGLGLAIPIEQATTVNDSPDQDAEFEQLRDDYIQQGQSYQIDLDQMLLNRDDEQEHRDLIAMYDLAKEEAIATELEA
jgi:hypothetical protein